MMDTPIVAPPVRHRVVRWLLTRPVAHTYDVRRAQRSRFVWRMVPRVERCGGMLDLFELRALGVINGVFSSIGDWCSDRSVVINVDGRIEIVVLHDEDESVAVYIEKLKTRVREFGRRAGR